MGLHEAYKDRAWTVHPEAERLLAEILDERLAACPDARTFQGSLIDSCAVRLRDILDHLTFDDDATAERIAQTGWREQAGIWQHPGGYFPAFVRQAGPTTSWFRVESADHFARVHCAPQRIDGAQHGPLRKLIAFVGDGFSFGAIERAGYAGFDVPAIAPSHIRAARVHFQALSSRRREFDSVVQGLAHTEQLVDAAVAELGAHWACDLWLRAERAFWMTRCRSAAVQKARQDATGIGWSNIDHHTYDSSRLYYRHTIRIFESLGYQLREMLYAGELAGWGSQVLEQPTLKSTIFADVDLAPEELAIDFAHDELPELPRHKRAGMLSILHGESILEAGLNHVAGLYDRRALQEQFRAEGIAMMSPFSDFAHLFQELTSGDWAAVDPKRVDLLESGGHISPDEAEQIRLNGAILSHLENIERNDGFKGFNREGIDSVLRKLDPRAYAAAHADATTA